MAANDPFSEFRDSATPTKKPAAQAAFDEFHSHDHGTPKDDAFKGLHEPANDAPRREEYPEFRAHDASKGGDAFAGFRSPASTTVNTPSHDEFPEYRTHAENASATPTPDAAAPQKPLA